MTNFNVTKKDLHGETTITSEHVRNNTDVRGVLSNRGIRPEELPKEEDIRKLEKRASKDVAKIVGSLKKK